MDTYLVQITDEALADMEQIYDYIANVLKSPQNAMGQYDRIADSIMKLDTMPERYRVVAWEPEGSQGLRRMLVDNYSVFYLVLDGRVVVTDVLYSASDMQGRIRNRTYTL